MCGIVTQFSRNGRTVKEEALWRATHELLTMTSLCVLQDVYRL